MAKQKNIKRALPGATQTLGNPLKSLFSLGTMVLNNAANHSEEESEMRVSLQYEVY